MIPLLNDVWWSLCWMIHLMVNNPSVKWSFRLLIHRLNDISVEWSFSPMILLLNDPSVVWSVRWMIPPSHTLVVCAVSWHYCPCQPFSNACCVLSLVHSFLLSFILLVYLPFIPNHSLVCSSILWSISCPSDHSFGMIPKHQFQQMWIRRFFDTDLFRLGCLWYRSFWMYLESN